MSPSVVDGKPISDPELYFKLAAPVPLAEVQPRIDAFLRELEELRVKHLIPELLVAAGVFSLEDSEKGALGLRVSSCQRGSSYVAPLLAYDLYSKFTTRALDSVLSAMGCDVVERVRERHGPAEFDDVAG